MLPRAFSDTRCMCSKALQSAATAQLQGGGARPAGARHGAAERRASMRVALRRAASDGHDGLATVSVCGAAQPSLARLCPRPRRMVRGDVASEV